MSYRDLEQKFNKKRYQVMGAFFRPLLLRLEAAQITPDTITFFRAIIFAIFVMYPLFVYGQIFWATFAYFFLFWLLDALDGQLARHLGRASDRGKFNDMFVDILGYSVFLLGLAYAGVGDAFVLFYHVIVHGALYLVASIYYNERQPSDWIIKPEPNQSYLKILAHLFIAFFVLFDWAVIDIGFMALNAWMTILVFYYFIQLQKRSHRSLREDHIN